MKNIKRLSLVFLTLFLVGCGGTNTNTSSTEATSTVNPADYPDVTLNVKAVENEVEIGQTIEVKAVVSTSATDRTCSFTSSDTSIATVTVNEKGNVGTVTGVKEGEVTITVTSTANPTVTGSVKITVIKTKPSLRQALINIQALDSYTLTVGEYDSGSMGTPTNLTFVTKDTIIRTDYDGEPILKNDSGRYLYGEKAISDDKVVYLTFENNKITQNNALLVQGDAGLMNANDFMGLKDQATQPFEVGTFYSLNAINPNWVTDTKSETNTYEIDGYSMNEKGKPDYIEGAFIECMLWNFMDAESYEDAVLSVQDDYYFTLSNMVDTTITVVGEKEIEVQIVVDGTTYEMVMSDKNTTSIDSIGTYNEDLVDWMDGTFTASAPVEAEKLEQGIAAINTNNYVQKNQVFPDHHTECDYDTFFTPNYVFYNCTNAYKVKYNDHLASDTDPWEDDPYGYVKTATGIKKFTYDETNKSVTLADDVEAGTDANTSLPEFENYLSSNVTFTTDLKYAFGTEESAIWNGRSTKYYSCNSRQIFEAILTYYAPEDLEDDDDPEEETVVEKVHVGVGVEIKSGAVTSVNLTAGSTPYTSVDNWDPTDHTYGVNYFSVTNFGNATENDVDSLLQAYINK